MRRCERKRRATRLVLDLNQQFGCSPAADSFRLGRHGDDIDADRKRIGQRGNVDLDDRAVNRRAQYGGKIEGPLQRQSWRRDRVGQDWQEEASHVVAPLEAPRHYRRHVSRN